MGEGQSAAGIQAAVAAFGHRADHRRIGRRGSGMIVCLGGTRGEPICSDMQSVGHGEP